MDEALPIGWNRWPADARDHFIERLGIADDLGLATDRGSPAWEIARCEAALMTADAPPQTRGDLLAAVVSLVLGVPVSASVRQPGRRFDGEPDWSNIPLAGGASGLDAAAPCRIGGHDRWWRIAGKNGVWTCGACHPPVRGLDIEWNRPPAAAVANTAESPAEEPSNPGMLALEWLGLDRPKAEEGP